MHPILEVASSVRTTIYGAADVNPSFMSTADKAEALRELAAAKAQLTELHLRVLATATDLAEESAAHNPATWLSTETRSRHEDARAQWRLARSMDLRYQELAAGMREGSVNADQAHVIAACLDALPREVGTELLGEAEANLIHQCAKFGPRELSKLGRRILDVVAPEIADEAEAKRLAALEEAGRRKTRLTLRRLGDGTTRLSGRLPDAAATRLATYLEAFTNPRKTTQEMPDPIVASLDPLARLTYPRRLGEAFVQLLECMEPNRLPLHSGDATTLIITMSLDQLRSDLATADLLGGGLVPGADPDRITAHEARRMACSAHLIPAVLGADSEVLDLGRGQRLFSRAQRKALLLRDQTCLSEGCQLPGTWAEAHHWVSWLDGGLTDLDNAGLLCRHHHQRAHDPAFTTEHLPNGDVRFRRRR
ncbi:MAG: DUF222 domain-containing protein [Marmoricola sp.]